MGSNKKEINAPLIVVSNRLPFVLSRNGNGELVRKQSAGGLVTAVAPVVVQCKGTWIGWSSLFDLKPDESIPESDPKDYAPTAGLKSNQIIPVHIDKIEFEEYYNGCCNGMFWPLFHSMPDRANFVYKDWKTYCKVNEEFANCSLDALKNIIKTLDAVGEYNTIPLIWIHDYHLLTTATKIRQVCGEDNLRCKLGFFLHIPFPSWDIMRLLPWDDQVLQGMLAFDFVAFHIEDYCLNFIDCCCRRLGCRVDRTNLLIEHAGRTIKVKALPIGIPFKRFVEMSEKAPSFLKISDDVKVILGVDRLDYTKGLVNRILAFEKLLEKYPEFVEKVVFLQISVPSRTNVKEYKQLKDETELLIGRINGRFSVPNWSPIRYIYGCLSQEQLAALYRDCAVALVTPLRDGMNLVAKEFVACQIRTPGVLILSPFAGAGGTMHEALIVNPYELDEMAQVMNRALKMSLDERVLRMTQLRHREQLLDVNHWMRSVFSTMGALKEDNEAPQKSMQLQLDDFDMYLSNHIAGASKLSLILDYDGTLTPFTSHPDLAIISEETIRVLQRLTQMSDINIAIISGRSLDNVKALVGVENITYAGNHGIEILHPDGTNFVHPMPKQAEENILRLRTQLLEEACKEGAWVENKGIMLIYHYRHVPLAKREYFEQLAFNIFRSYGFEPNKGILAIECKLPIMWDQGRASIYILRTTYGVDWSERVRVIYAGNEDAMMALKGIACTFRVDPSPMVQTTAKFRLSGPDAVLIMLKLVEKEMHKRLLTLNQTVRNTRIQNVSSAQNIRSLISIDQNEEEKENMILLARRSKLMT